MKQTEQFTFVSCQGSDFPDFSLLSSLSPDRSYTVFPGFCDVHVHFREPGFSYKETILSGSRAAAHGGYTDVCTMPNLNPVPDSLAHLAEQEALIKQTAVIGVHPYGAITVGQKGEQIADLEGMADRVIAFSDDGRGVQDEGLMKEAMQRAKTLHKMIVAHCEDNSLLNGGCVHAGAYAEAHGHKGIVSASEWKPIERDLQLCKETGCAYHVCHVSCKESVELIRDAKKDGVNVTCETGPHYLLLTDDDLQEDGRFKMNPPLRAKEDRDALLAGITDGTVDMIATDHAPHSAEEKSRGLKKSAFGIVGLETAFPLLYTYLVKKGILSLEALVALLSENPRRRFSLTGSPGWTVWDLNAETVIDPGTFLSLGRATPFAGTPAAGVCRLTLTDGAVAYRAQ